jgi:hypothetical protein
MPKQPSRRPRATAEASGPSVEDPTTERALTELREKVATDRKAAVAPLVQRVTFIPQSQTVGVDESLFTQDDGDLYFRDDEGRVIQITAAGALAGSGAISITSDLDFNDFSALDVHRLEVHNNGSSPATASSIYMVNDEWFVNDGNGNEIQLTDGGELAFPDTHGPRFEEKPAELNAVLSGTPINFTNGRGVGSAAGACSFFAVMPHIRRGCRILSVSGTFAVGLGAGTSSINLKRRNANLLAPTSLGSASSGVGAGGQLVVTLSGLTETVGAGQSYVLEVNTGRSQDSLETITVEFDRP